MNEVDYYKSVYSRFWEKQTKRYGYGTYERKLVKLIAKSSPKEVFEVGIGTGWPIGAALKRKGIKVDGCDISESAVELAKRELDNPYGIWSGEVLEYQDNKRYDVTYCARVSWYIADFYKTISKMSSMTKPGGYIVFDVMDKNNIYCLKIGMHLMRDRYFRFLGIDVDESFGHHFISILKMKRFLKKNGLTYQCWGERKLTKSRDISNTPKVVFVCRKESDR